ncbi:hypothetical protein KIN20_026181 [Parelaphostrongylus tenuis]|uniref:Uncharacterized protein n=1 Tax=Parelaphostrongylus tenuis TaxID=148309 RepID=A0AAD5QXB5_PARTN|nr:hypothetical protein KIN20_026181 [Parelaphostrongylus tenuis]
MPQRESLAADLNGRRDLIAAIWATCAIRQGEALAWSGAREGRSAAVDISLSIGNFSSALKELRIK